MISQARCQQGLSRRYGLEELKQAAEQTCFACNIMAGNARQQASRCFRIISGQAADIQVCLATRQWPSSAQQLVMPKTDARQTFPCDT
jgi:hypothetical protein